MEEVRANTIPGRTIQIEILEIIVEVETYLEVKMHGTVTGIEVLISDQIVGYKNKSLLSQIPEVNIYFTDR